MGLYRVKCRGELESIEDIFLLKEIEITHTNIVTGDGVANGRQC